MLSRFFITLLLLQSLLPVFSQSQAFISGTVFNSKNDTLTITIYEDEYIEKTKEIKTPLVKNDFIAKLSIQEPVKILISDGRANIEGIIEPKDSLIITADFNERRPKPMVTGKGKEKFLFQYEKSGSWPVVNNNFEYAKKLDKPLDILFHLIDSVENKNLALLHSHKNKMSEQSFLLLSAELEIAKQRNLFHTARIMYNMSVRDILKTKEAELTPKVKQILKSLISFKTAYYRSYDYCKGAWDILNATYILSHSKQTLDIISKYQFFEDHLPRKLRLPAQTVSLFYDVAIISDKDTFDLLMTKIYSPKDSLYRSYIEKRFYYIYENALTDGMPAPDFTLENNKGEKVHLSDFRGKVVFVDFWFGACGPCHLLFEKLKPVKEYFKSNSDVVFLNISTDDKEIWTKALKQFKIEGYHCYTENKKSQHQIIRDYKVIFYPHNRLIGKDGKILKAAPSREVEELIKQIESGLQK